jgi:predicted RNA-binding Zn-ribbon protein involved in translation (DUF1610 family)
MGARASRSTEEVTTPMARLSCPECGAEMNQHAEKLAYPESAAELRLMDPAGEGLLEEIHACPRCGDVESRRVPLAGSAGRAQDTVKSAP